MILTFQQDVASDLSQPWPVTVDETGKVLFMENYGIKRTLVGFESPDAPQELAVYRWDWFDDPQSVLGLIPVYTGPENPGGFFSVGNPIVHVKVQELD